MRNEMFNLKQEIASAKASANVSVTSGKNSMDRNLVRDRADSEQ
jgi:hypothetical protein